MVAVVTSRDKDKWVDEVLRVGKWKWSNVGNI